MDTQEANFHQEMKVGIVEDLLLNYENEEKGPAYPNTSEEINIKLEQVEAQSTFNGVGYAYSLHTGKHFVKPEFVLPEELGIKVENQEDQHYTEESQVKVNFLLSTYVKSELTTPESEPDEPVKRPQNSRFIEETIKEESFAETKFIIQGEPDIKYGDKGNDLFSTKKRTGKSQAQRQKEYRQRKKIEKQLQSGEKIPKTNAQRQKEYRARKKIEKTEKQLQSAKKIPKTNAQRQQEFRQKQKMMQQSEKLDLVRKKNAERVKRYRDKLKSKKQRAELDSLLSSKETDHRHADQPDSTNKE